MLNNELTLPVDVLNNGTLVNTVFTRFDGSNQNRSVYIGPSHTLEARELLGFYRTPPKKSGNYKGSAKCAVKLTSDVEVPGVDSSTTLTAPEIADLQFSLPVGITLAQAKVIRQRLIALLDNDTVMDAVMLRQDI